MTIPESGILVFFRERWPTGNILIPGQNMINNTRTWKYAAVSGIIQFLSTSYG